MLEATHSSAFLFAPSPSPLLSSRTSLLSPPLLSSPFYACSSRLTSRPSMPLFTPQSRCSRKREGLRGSTAAAEDWGKRAWLAGLSWLLLPLSCMAASPIIDEARSLGSNERVRLEENLKSFEEETKYRIRVLTVDERRLDTKLSKEEIKSAWNLPDDRSLIVIVEAGKGNVLSFNAGGEISKLLPARFFNELSGRMGNVYSIEASGENSAIEESVSIIEKCLRKGGCALVPGIGEDQYYATLACTSMSGLVSDHD
eukprot:758853-Hanusia_phi.AAC.1